MSVQKIETGSNLDGHGSRWPFLFALAAPLAACAGHASSEQDTVSANTEPADDLATVIADSDKDAELNLLARIHFSPTHVVEFYEPQPGLILASEAATAAEQRVVFEDDMKLRADELYRKLTKLAEVPGPLLAAVERLDSTLDATEPDAARPPAAVSTVAGETGGGAATDFVAPPVTPAPTGQVRQAVSPPVCSSAWFTQQGFCPAGNQFQWCLVDWWNGAFAQTGATDYAWGAVCAETGAMGLSVTGVGAWSVPQSTWRSAWRQAGRTCFPIAVGSHCYYNDFSIQYDVISAAGKRFQFGGYFEQRPSCTYIWPSGCL